MPKYNDRNDISQRDRRAFQAEYHRRRPFWMPAMSYYVLAMAVAAAFFFLVWGILHDNAVETPWVTSGVSASIVLAGAVILREVLLRRARNRFFRHQRAVENAQSFYGSERRGASKLSVERNAAMIKQIRQKSDASKVFSTLSAGHREVFELCAEYLALVDRDLKSINAGSKRLEPLLKGRTKAVEYHRFHMLSWAEIETRTLTNEALTRLDVDEKFKAAQDAINVIDAALTVYPSEQALLDSRELIGEMAVSIKVSHWVEEAERAAFKGDYAGAKSLYRDALFYLGRDNVHNAERERAAIRINQEIERIRLMEDDPT
ncbi:MAG: hypothetical protein IPI64_07570 [Chloracidobacterium sp.]|nr:hypothetical protein [Chloracidobacterium sp.]